MEAGASCSSYQDLGSAPTLTARPELRTLEDALKTFGLLPRLRELEDSLEEVRRQRRTPEQHEAECRRLDKELQRLSFDHHPDRVMGSGGSREDIERAKVLQTALNATRTVLRTLTKLFLEDVDVDYRYGFFAKLDIGLLGNEDSVERHVDDVLFKMSLASDIKQEEVIPQVKEFLEASRSCVQKYLDGDYAGFSNDRSRAFYHFEKCVRGNGKLLAELDDVESGCISEQLHSAVPVVSEMKSNCLERIERLEALLRLSKRGVIGDILQPVHRDLLSPDDYLLCPLVRYVNVILACSTMERAVRNAASMNWFELLLFVLFHTLRSTFVGAAISSAVRVASKIPLDIQDSNEIRLLQKLASACLRTTWLHRLQMTMEDENYPETRKVIEKRFRETLEKVQAGLEAKFRIDDYSVVGGGSRKHTSRELKECREALAELKNKVREMEDTFEENKRDAERATRRYEELKSDQHRVGYDLKECLARTKKWQEFFQDYKQESEAEECLQKNSLKKKVDLSRELFVFDESEESIEKETDLKTRGCYSLLEESEEMVERCRQKIDRMESSSFSEKVLKNS